MSKEQTQIDMYRSGKRMTFWVDGETVKLINRFQEANELNREAALQALICMGLENSRDAGGDVDGLNGGK